MFSGLSRLTTFLKQHFLWLLVVSYGLAIASPDIGNALREHELSPKLLLGKPLTTPLLLLAILFFNVGLNLGQKKRVAPSAWSPVALVVAANWLVPVLCLLLAYPLLRGVVGESGLSLYLGMVLVAAMPIANSSTAWTQNLDGDVGHSVSSVILSTLLAPLVSVAIVSWLWINGNLVGDIGYSLSDRILSILIGCLLIPLAAGWLVIRHTPLDRFSELVDLTKLFNLLILLLLNYSNAALALPQAFSEGRYAELGLSFLMVSLVCGVSLWVAGCLARWSAWSAPMSISASLGISMKNTGTALVLAGTLLPPGSLAILVIVSYTLVQHMMVAVLVRHANLDSVPRESISHSSHSSTGSHLMTREEPHTLATSHH